MPAGIYIAAAGCALRSLPKQTTVTRNRRRCNWPYTFSPRTTRRAGWCAVKCETNVPVRDVLLAPPARDRRAERTEADLSLSHDLRTLRRVPTFPRAPLGPIGALIAIRSENVLLKRSTIAGLICFLVLVAYYVKSTNNYGGESYGFRWYIASMPVLLLMAVPLAIRINRSWKWALLTVMLLVSCYSTFESARVGWHLAGVDKPHSGLRQHLRRELESRNRGIFKYNTSRTPESMAMES